MGFTRVNEGQGRDETGLVKPTMAGRGQGSKSLMVLSYLSRNPQLH
jgi:hypothetical protein